MPITCLDGGGGGGAGGGQPRVEVGGGRRTLHAGALGPHAAQRMQVCPYILRSVTVRFELYVFFTVHLEVPKSVLYMYF
jgi:hypothetical protein